MLHNEATAAISAINPAIFEGLHIKVGFDFEAPFTVERIPAPFTIKKAWKAVEADHKPSTSTAAIIMRDSSVNPHHYMYDFRLVTITADSIDEYGKMSYHKYDRQHRYNMVFTDFYTKGDFNDLRKLDTCEAFIIAQRTDFIKKPVTRETDWTQRQPHIQPGVHDIPCRFYYANRKPTMTIDKSNYRVDIKREDLKRRAAKLRSDREKAAADLATRNTATERMNTITDHFNAAKRRIINALEAATPTDEQHIKAINDYINRYGIGLHTIVWDIDRFNTAATENKFTSPDKYNAAYTSIINRLDAIMPTTEPAIMVKAAHTTATKGA